MRFKNFTQRHIHRAKYGPAQDQVGPTKILVGPSVHWCYGYLRLFVFSFFLLGGPFWTVTSPTGARNQGQARNQGLGGPCGDNSLGKQYAWPMKELGFEPVILPFYYVPEMKFGTWWHPQQRAIILVKDVNESS